MSKKFTRKEIADKGNQNNALFIIDNVVYDVTEFLDHHPGGHEVLVNEVGKDATESFDDIGHSLDAKELMKKYVVGEVAVEDRIEVKKSQSAWASSSEEGSVYAFLTSWQLHALLGVLATAIYNYLKD